MRDQEKFRASQRDLGACKGTSLLGSGVESPLICYTKKKREKINTNYMLKILQMSLIE